MIRALKFLARWRRSGSRKVNDTSGANCNFDQDDRSKTLIFVPHCLLNQNARDAGSADFSAMMKPLLDVLTANDVGIIQLPCPELMVLGLGRRRQASPPRTIRELLELEESQVRLGHFIEQVVYQIREYQAKEFHIIGILGKNGSPTCGVQASRYVRASGVREGVFIRLLRKRLQAEGLDIEIVGIDDHRQQKAIDWVLKRIPRRRLSSAGADRHGGENQ
jgi:predicted secreted protein